MRSFVFSTRRHASHPSVRMPRATKNRFSYCRMSNVDLPSDDPLREEGAGEADQQPDVEEQPEGMQLRGG